VIGDIVTYTFTIKNLTKKTTTVRISDFLPEGATFQQQDGWSRPSFLDRGVLTSSLITVPAGETRKRTIRVIVNQNGSLRNYASLFTSRPISFSENTDEEFLGDAEVLSEVKEPEITGAEVRGKKLVVRGLYGSFSDDCPVILIGGQEEKTIRDPENPSTLTAKKGAKKIAPGETVSIKVRLCNGTETAGFPFTRPQ
jgi:uncharacterized protein DUF11